MFVISRFITFKPLKFSAIEIKMFDEFLFLFYKNKGASAQLISLVIY